MIKAVLADIDNTLLDFNKCAEYAIKCAFAKWGLQYTDKALSTFFKINTRLWNDIEKGIINKAGLYKVRWAQIFAELGIELDGQSFELDFLQSLSQSYHTVDGAEELLKYLSGKYMLFAASNGPHAEQVSRLTNAGLICYFKDVFTSERIGFQKPRKEFFMGCLERAGGLLPHEAVIIGDSLNADIIGGKACGLVTCFFNYGNVALDGNIPADFTVQALSDIKTLL